MVAVVESIHSLGLCMEEKNKKPKYLFHDCKGCKAVERFFKVDVSCQTPFNRYYSKPWGPGCSRRRCQIFLGFKVEPFHSHNATSNDILRNIYRYSKKVVQDNKIPKSDEEGRIPMLTNAWILWGTYLLLWGVWKVRSQTTSHRKLWVSNFKHWPDSELNMGQRQALHHCHDHYLPFLLAAAAPPTALHLVRTAPPLWRHCKRPDAILKNAPHSPCLAVSQR